MMRMLIAAEPRKLDMRADRRFGIIVDGKKISQLKKENTGMDDWSRNDLCYTIKVSSQNLLIDPCLNTQLSTVIK